MILMSQVLSTMVVLQNQVGHQIPYLITNMVEDFSTKIEDKIKKYLQQDKR